MVTFEIEYLEIAISPRSDLRRCSVRRVTSEDISEIIRLISLS